MSPSGAISTCTIMAARYRLQNGQRYVGGLVAGAREPREAPADDRDHRRPDQEHADVRGAGQEARHALLLLSLEQLLVAHELLRGSALRSDLVDWDRAVGRQVDRDAEHGASALE